MVTSGLHIYRHALKKYLKIVLLRYTHVHTHHYQYQFLKVIALIVKQSFFSNWLYTPIISNNYIQAEDLMNLKGQSLAAETHT